MLARYASGMGVSAELVNLAERTSPDQLYMLTGSDIAALARSGRANSRFDRERSA